MLEEGSLHFYLRPSAVFRWWVLTISASGWSSTAPLTIHLFLVLSNFRLARCCRDSTGDMISEGIGRKSYSSELSQNHLGLVC